MTTNTTNIKRYVVKDSWKDYAVTLEVNQDLLTPERAALLNDFWTDHEQRLNDCDGDIVKTAIQLFGQHAICTFLQDGGASFSEEWVANRISRDLRGEEGWGAEEEGSGDFGWCGIRVIDADVYMPDFDELEIEALQP